MKILELQLLTSDLELLHRFYVDLLGLNLLEFRQDFLMVQVGSSRLQFKQQTGFSGHYHFAFDVPENQLEDAKTWLETRTELIADTDGTIVFDSQNWNAHQIYFRDPHGNILELIARHELSNASQIEFSSNSFLNISEIGLACDSVPNLVQWLEQYLKLGVYKSSSDTFAPVGDANGLLILVQNAREWFPNTGVHATPQPVHIVIAGRKNQTLEIPNLPYEIRAVLEEV
jgi:catechol 2,3-dioxygenase-like lactoylglutathione lyase family enzyme